MKSIPHSSTPWIEFSNFFPSSCKRKLASRKFGIKGSEAWRESRWRFIHDWRHRSLKVWQRQRSKHSKTLMFVCVSLAGDVELARPSTHNKQGRWRCRHLLSLSFLFRFVSLCVFFSNVHDYWFCTVCCCRYCVPVKSGSLVACL